MNPDIPNLLSQQYKIQEHHHRQANDAIPAGVIRSEQKQTTQNETNKAMKRTMKLNKTNKENAAKLSMTTNQAE
jgi:hypothetical protein